MRTIARAIQSAFECARMNYAILGNEVAHVHWHLIPRYTTDPNWGRPPWPIMPKTQNDGPRVPGERAAN
ncbi:MAG: HIT family protein [Egibacteraceae bacterium]